MPGANESRLASPRRWDTGAAPRVPAALAEQGREAPSIPPALVEQARRRPSSWVYEVDRAAVRDGPVSATQIRRAWRTDAAGAIVAGEYVDNAYYRPPDPAARGRGRRAWRLGLAALALALAIGAVLVLVPTGGSHMAGTPTARARPAGAPLPTASVVARTQRRRAQARAAVVPGPAVRPRPRHRPAPARPDARLSVRASAPVWVCLQGAGGRVLSAGQILAPGQTLSAVRGSVFEVFAGNGAFTMLVDGFPHRASGSPDPVAYLVRAGTVTELRGYPAQACAG